VITLSGRAGRVGNAARPLLEQFHACKPWRGVSMVAPLSLAQRIVRTRADVVHLHSGVWFKGALAARLAGVRNVVYTEHGREHDDPWLLRWLDRRAAGLTSHVVAVSDRLRRYLSNVIGVSPERLHTIKNGVDVRKYSPGRVSQDLRASLGIPAEALVIGSMGRLEEVKAYGRLLQAFADVSASREVAIPVYMVICGEGSQRRALEAQAERLGIVAVIRLPGWVEDPVPFYRLFDIFSLTSVSEGAPLSLMEAMACGAVPLVTDVGANADILGPELADQVVRSEDAQALRRALIASVRSPPHRERLRRLARERIVKSYNLDDLTAAYERLYLS